MLIRCEGCDGSVNIEDIRSITYPVHEASTKEAVIAITATASTQSMQATDAAKCADIAVAGTIDIEHPTSFNAG